MNALLRARIQAANDARAVVEQIDRIAYMRDRLALAQDQLERLTDKAQASAHVVAAADAVMAQPVHPVATRFWPSPIFWAMP